jgi:hypothetical protein
MWKNNVLLFPPSMMGYVEHKEAPVPTIGIDPIGTMKIIIFVHTCKKYEHSRAKKIENTWGNKENVVFITDDENSSLKNHIYIGKYKRGYTYHPENVNKMFQLFINNYSNYDWFMIIDDDSYLYIEKLLGYLSFYDPNDYLMMGDFLNWCERGAGPLFNGQIAPGPNYSVWAGGGPGIVFSKSCIVLFLELMTNIEIRYFNHDVWLHYLYLQGGQSKIKRIHCPGFHQNRAKELIKKYPLDSKLLISIHLERNMELFDMFYNKETLKTQ